MAFKKVSFLTEVLLKSGTLGGKNGYKRFKVLLTVIASMVEPYYTVYGNTGTM